MQITASFKRHPGWTSLLFKVSSKRATLSNDRSIIDWLDVQPFPKPFFFVTRPRDGSKCATFRRSDRLQDTALFCQQLFLSLVHNVVYAFVVRLNIRDACLWRPIIIKALSSQVIRDRRKSILYSPLKRFAKVAPCNSTFDGIDERSAKFGDFTYGSGRHLGATYNARRGELDPPPALCGGEEGASWVGAGGAQPPIVKEKEITANLQKISTVTRCGVLRPASSVASWVRSGVLVLRPQLDPNTIYNTFLYIRAYRRTSI